MARSPPPTRRSREERPEGVSPTVRRTSPPRPGRLPTSPHQAGAANLAAAGSRGPAGRARRGRGYSGTRRPRGPGARAAGRPSYSRRGSFAREAIREASEKRRRPPISTSSASFGSRAPRDLDVSKIRTDAVRRSGNEGASRTARQPILGGVGAGGFEPP